IRSIFVRGERAIEERKVPEVMALVSRDYRDDEGLRFGSLRLLAARQMRDAQSIEITIPDQLLHIEVEPDGKHAWAQARVDIRVATSFGTTEDLSSTLSFRFVKEPVRYYLMFPGEEWRLIKAEGWHGMAGEG